MVCTERDGDGYCTHSVVDGTYANVNCTGGPDLTFTAIVIDEDGNASEPAVLTWNG